jgi:hypothetical protein
MALDWSEKIPDRKNPDPYYTKAVGELWKVMLDLIYEGNGRTAVDLLDAVWPAHLENKAAGLAYFIGKVRDFTKENWEAIDAMQDPPVAWPAVSKE